MPLALDLSLNGLEKIKILEHLAKCLVHTRCFAKWILMILIYLYNIFGIVDYIERASGEIRLL